MPAPRCQPLLFDFLPSRELIVERSAGQITSDAGWSSNPPATGPAGTSISWSPNVPTSFVPPPESITTRSVNGGKGAFCPQS